MAVTFHIPGPLRQFTEGHERVQVNVPAKTVDEALQALWARYPSIRDRIATEQGAIRQHINIFVGNEEIRYSGGITCPISDGAEISIVPAVSGG